MRLSFPSFYFFYFSFITVKLVSLDSLPLTIDFSSLPLTYLFLLSHQREEALKHAQVREGLEQPETARKREGREMRLALSLWLAIREACQKLFRFRLAMECLP